MYAIAVQHLRALNLSQREFNTLLVPHCVLCGQLLAASAGCVGGFVGVCVCTCVYVCASACLRASRVALAFRFDVRLAKHAGAAPRQAYNHQPPRPPLCFHLYSTYTP